MPGWSQAYILKITDMKNIFKSLTAFVFGMVLFASCQNEMDPLAQAVTVDKTEVEVAGQSAEAQKVMVKADGAWVAMVGADWLVVEPMSGNGDTEVEISAKDNVDSYNELNGPRSAQVSFLYGTSGVASVKVNQLGEAGLDASRTYSLVTKQEELTAGTYLIVFKHGDKNLVAKPFTKNYDYLYGEEAEVKDNAIVMPNASKAFTFETSEGGLKFAMPDGRYLYRAGYTSFNAKAAIDDDVDDWSLTLRADGTVEIKSLKTEEVVQFDTQYESAGGYKPAKEANLYPYLYKDSAVASDEILTVAEAVTAAFDATSISISVTSNKTWKVRNHDEWIKTFTKSGTGNGKIEVTFDANTSTTEQKVATFTVIGETTNVKVVLTQKVHKDIVVATVEQFLDAAEDDTPYQLTGKVVGLQTGDYGNFNLKDETGSVYVYGLTATKQTSNDKSFPTLGITEGDIVTLVGIRSSKNGTPRVDGPAYYISHEEGEPEGPTDATVAQFIAAEKDSGPYRVTGYISYISVSEQHGNASITIVDGIGNKMDMYRAVDADKGVEKLKSLKVGDMVVAVGSRDEYNGKIQMPQGCYVESSQSYTEISIADFLAADDIKTTYYRVTGTLKAIADGDISASFNNANLTITDGTNDLYLFRLAPGISGKKIDELGLAEGVKIVVVGQRDVYNDAVQMPKGGQFVQIVEDEEESE